MKKDREAIGAPTDGQGGVRSGLVPGRASNVLLLSMRRLNDLVAFCLQYEFEDVIVDLTGADRVDAADRELLEASRRRYRLARLASGSRRFARAWAPRPSTVRLQHDYELFFPVFNNAHEVYSLGAIPDWRARSRVAACFINELIGESPTRGPRRVPDYLLELLTEFDHVFLGQSNPLEELSRTIGRPCSYLPLAADVLRFSPYPDPPARTIDVCNIGRRSKVTHDALMRLADDARLFYYYDTAAASGPSQKQRTFRVDNANEHRRLLASILKRSRYFIAHRSRVNEPEFTMGRDEISGRFYEGAAAGTVMLGEAPRTAEFKSQFGWPDVVIEVPFDSPEIGEILIELDRNPERLARIRRDNFRNAALRHDWVHRLGTVLETLGIPPTDAMLERENRLKTLAGLASVPTSGDEETRTKTSGNLFRRAGPDESAERPLDSRL